MSIQDRGHRVHHGLAMSMPTEPDTSAFIRLNRVYKVHRVGDVGVAALGGVSFEVARGEFAAIVGPSGAGKSTILNLIGGVDAPTAGLVSVAGTDLAQLDSAGLSDYRSTMVGFLWQGATKNLVPYLTVAQNVELPQLLAGLTSAADRRRRTALMLELMGLADRARHLPAMLSGGEQQRAGLAVALAHKPPVVLADEPTAEIDAEGAEQVVRALRAACAELSSTVVMATHDLLAASQADVTFRLIDGRVRGPAGRARLDSAGRITLPEAAASLFGSTDTELDVDLDVELDGEEVRIRRPQDAIEPRGSVGGWVGGTVGVRGWDRSARTAMRLGATQPAKSVAAKSGDAGRPADAASDGIETPLLAAEELHRAYGRGETRTVALRGVSLQLARGELVVVIGPSGSGKSTLLGLIGGFESPDSGRVVWRGRPLAELSAAEVADFRSSELGVVFQSLGLFPALTASENVYLPLLISGTDPDSSASVTDMWLRQMGLQDRAEHRLNELSLGQQQRVAVARALAPDPAIVLADEPTAEVDREAADVVVEALREVTRRGGGVILASHDPRVLRVADRVLVLRAGQLVAEGSPAETAEFLSTD